MMDNSAVAEHIEEQGAEPVDDDEDDDLPFQVALSRVESLSTELDRMRGYTDAFRFVFEVLRDTEPGDKRREAGLKAAQFLAWKCTTSRRTRRPP
jgi:hypothetical protein